MNKRFKAATFCYSVYSIVGVVRCCFSAFSGINTKKTASPSTTPFTVPSRFFVRFHSGYFGQSYTEWAQYIFDFQYFIQNYMPVNPGQNLILRTQSQPEYLDFKKPKFRRR